LELDDFLERLSSKERDLVVLHCLQGHDWKYISQLTGMPVGSARVQHFNAMRKLERMAEEAGASKKKK
jgi:DNA-directed RNA polymerase specialized sigma24 family protein